nr:sensor histidine kinase [uncultured Acetatifactor sp.]
MDVMEEMEQDLGRIGMMDVREEEREESRQERRKRERSGSGRYRLTGALGAKIFAFFLLALSGIAGVWGLAVCVNIGENGFYEGSLEEVLQRQLQSPAYSALYAIIGYLEAGDIREAEAYCRERNVDIELVQEEGGGEETVLWSTWEGYEPKYIAAMYTMLELQEDYALNGIWLRPDKEYLLRACLKPDIPMEDNFRRLAQIVEMVYNARYALIGISVAGTFLCIFMFIFLMCSAGHQNGKEGIVPGVLATIPFDVLTLLFGGGAAVAGTIGLNVIRRVDSVAGAIALTCVGAALAVWGTLYCMEFATRLKLGGCFRYTVIYRMLRGVWRMLRFLGSGFVSLLRGVPMVMTTVIAYLGLCILEFFGILVFLSGAEELSSLLWIMEKAALFVVVVYIALSCRKLLMAGQALAEGNADYKVDTSRLLWSFKEHGENLNSLGQGISKAVAERLKSERLKTELITNVSHDLKTPLTSIINYADLIYEESGAGGRYSAGNASASGNVSGGSGAGTMEKCFTESGEDDSCGRGEEPMPGNASDTDNASGSMSRVAEYAEVLLRQSRRLKKLLEDLLEASKATTGNLEVNLAPCEVGVLLSQAVGEYQQRMEERQLNLIARQPEEIASILADGRHLWRIFDNLLNNICKYAQENSRVYLSVEEREEHVLIVFRNMSKYPLDISAEELEERFVRGDRSRHMEGNGLGLSIAKSLVELQGGRMEITIDGDLFKVTLDFNGI